MRGKRGGKKRSKFHGKLPFFIESKIELLGSLPTRHFCVENTNCADWALSKFKYRPVLDGNSVRGLDVFTLKYLPKSPCYGRTWDLTAAVIFLQHIIGLALGLQLYILRVSGRCQWVLGCSLPFTVSGDSISSLTRVLGVCLLFLFWVWDLHLERWLMPSTALAAREWEGRDVRVWFFRSGNRTVLFSPSVFFWRINPSLAWIKAQKEQETS